MPESTDRFLRTLSVVAITAALCIPASAQEGPLQIVVGVRPSASYSEIDGFDSQQGFTLALDYFLTSRWAAEMSSTFNGYSRTGSGDNLSAFTIDLAGHYYFLRRPKLGLFAAAGLRYARSDFATTATSGTASGSSATGLLVGLGLDYSFSPRFSLRSDLTAVPIDLGGNADHLDGLSLGIGLGFRF